MPAIPVQIISRLDQAAAMLDPMRLRLLSELAEPESASGLARRLSLPRQRINYHLKELEKAELIELVEERRKGNCTERIVQATARSYQLDPAVLGPLSSEPSPILDVQIRLADPSDQDALAEDLAHGLEEIAHEYDDQFAANSQLTRVNIRFR